MVGFGDSLDFVLDVSGREHSLPGASSASVERFRELYQQHFRALSSYCGSLVGDRSAGAELAQEAFTRLFARWRSVRDPRAYVFYVGTTLATDWWRQRQRQEALLARLETSAPAHRDPDTTWLRDIVERLSPKLREAVLLHYYADLPVAEIARLVHRPVGTVKRRLHDARLALAQSMEDR